MARKGTNPSTGTLRSGSGDGARAAQFSSSGGTPPVMQQSMLGADIGDAGLRAYSGYVREEFLPALTGRQAARAYREMTDNSPDVGAIMTAITGVMRKVEWRTVPAQDMMVKTPDGGSDVPGSSPESIIYAQFADSLRMDMSHTWEDFIVEALTMLSYGYAPHEIVYKRRNGYQPSGSSTPSSMFDDGLIGIRKLPIRGQDTVLKWFFGPNGEILGLTQQPYTGTTIDVPIEKLLLFRPSQHKQNPEGKSVLRNAWISYTYIKRLQEMEAILYERMAGLPVLKIPTEILEGATGPNPNPQAVAAFNGYKRLVSNVRIDDQMGVIIPSDPYQNMNGPVAVPMFDFKLETPAASKSSSDANAPLIRHKNDLLTSVLADFLGMGHTSRGAQNLAETKLDVFYQSIEGWLRAIASVLNRHLLTRVWELNAFPIEMMPTYEPDLAQRIDLDNLSNFVLRLQQAGMPLFPSIHLENYLREAAGLPQVVEDKAYKQAVANAQPDKQDDPGADDGPANKGGGDDGAGS